MLSTLKLGGTERKEQPEATGLIVACHCHCAHSPVSSDPSQVSCYLWLTSFYMNFILTSESLGTRTSYFIFCQYEILNFFPLHSVPEFGVLIFIKKKKKKILPAVCYHGDHQSSTGNLAVVLNLGYSLESSEELLKNSNAWAPDKLKPNLFGG